MSSLPPINSRNNYNLISCCSQTTTISSLKQGSFPKRSSVTLPPINGAKNLHNYLPVPSHFAPPSPVFLAKLEKGRNHTSLPPIFQLSPFLLQLSTEKPNEIFKEENLSSIFETITYENGDSYFGEVQEKMRSGRGKMLNSKGELLCEGVYQNDVLNGFGISYFSNGDCYEGMFHVGEYEGFGMIKNKDGVLKFQGSFSSGIRKTGSEVLDKATFYIGSYDKSGDKSFGCIFNSETLICLYHGPFEDNQPKIESSSSNTLLPKENLAERVEDDLISYPDGSVYLGSTLDNKRDGYGTMKDPEGNTTYVGFYKDDLENGFGCATYQDGSSYIGLHLHGAHHGFGELKSKTQQITGNFINGLIESGRELNSNNTLSFFGNYMNNRPNYGALIKSDVKRSPRLVYRGHFKESEPHGSPILWKKDFAIFYGNCFAGKFNGNVAIIFDNEYEWYGNYVDDMPRDIGTMKNKKGEIIPSDQVEELFDKFIDGEFEPAKPLN